MIVDFLATIIGHPLVRIWSYRSTFFIFMTLFIGFSAVVPIDSISQASTSDNNYALNTFVVVGALVLIGVTSSVLVTTRVISLRTAMQDIPKRYIPLHQNDLPPGCSHMIEENFAKCEEIRSKALQAPSEVKHPGLSAPESELLPPLLSFDDAVRSIGLKLKWDHKFAASDIEIPPNLSFREIISYIENEYPTTDPDLCAEYVELYEELRYSGKLITEDRFIRFMELSMDFMKELVIHTQPESSPENAIYPSSTLTHSTFDQSRYSIRNRTQSYIPNHRPSVSNASAVEDYHPDVFDEQAFNDEMRRIITGHSEMSARTTATTSYNPFYE